MSLTWLEISKSALMHNAKTFRELSPGVKLMAVVKSNAYGHGLDVVPEVIDEFVDWFGVVNAQEAIFLRDHGVNKPILILSYFDEDLIEEILRKNISIAVYDQQQLIRLDAAAKKLKTKARVHLKIDTGTARLGTSPDQALTFALAISKRPNLALEGLFSHLAASEDKADYTEKQLDLFARVIADLEKENINIGLKHVACTASAMAYPKSRWNLMRIGIGMFGLSSYKSKSSNVNKISLQPALSWKAKVIQIKTIPKNSYVGYGCSYKTKKSETLAVLPIGYYEGFDRKLSNKGHVLINNVKCPVRGRVCMNLTIVDISAVPNATVGSEVVVIGRQGDKDIKVDDLAKKIHTINYEIVARLNPNLPRILTI